MPFGKVTATYKIGDEVHEATGTGYHDHNWMNVEMSHLLDHWWWAKGDVGPYTFIMAHLVAGKKYGYTPFHWFMIARDGKPVADDGTKVVFTTTGSDIDEHTGKPVPQVICFDYQRWRHALRSDVQAPEDVGHSEDARLRQGLAEGRGRADPVPRRVLALLSAAWTSGTTRAASSSSTSRRPGCSSRCTSRTRFTKRRWAKVLHHVSAG